MNYKGLYSFLKDISQNLGLTTQFFHGRIEQIDLTDVTKPLYIYSLPFSSSGTLTNSVLQVNETWVVELLFLMADQADSGLDQNNQDDLQAEMETITICENAANKFLHYVNENMISDALSKASDSLTIVSFSKRSSIKEENLMTGVVLTINLRVPDDFNYDCC